MGDVVDIRDVRRKKRIKLVKQPTTFEDGGTWVEVHTIDGISTTLQVYMHTELKLVEVVLTDDTGRPVRKTLRPDEIEEFIHVMVSKGVVKS